MVAAALVAYVVSILQQCDPAPCASLVRGRISAHQHRRCRFARVPTEAVTVSLKPLWRKGFQPSPGSVRSLWHAFR